MYLLFNADKKLVGGKNPDDLIEAYQKLELNINIKKKIKEKAPLPHDSIV
tara:strand:- start:42849 stop:42998 length:150 start_codon:yes stop_codon:yes gene_type:complete